jgi:hypothetical protein
MKCSSLFQPNFFAKILRAGLAISGVAIRFPFHNLISWQLSAKLAKGS